MALPCAVVVRPVPLVVAHPAGAVATAPAGPPVAAVVAPARYVVPAAASVVIPQHGAAPPAAAAAAAVRPVATVAGGTVQLRPVGTAVAAVAARPVLTAAAAPAVVVPAAARPWEAMEPRGTAASSAEDTVSATNSQVIELLESLEARVDLMSQMQQTKAALQQRARSVNQGFRGPEPQYQHGGGDWQEEYDYRNAYDGDVGGTAGFHGGAAAPMEAEAWPYEPAEDYPVATGQGAQCDSSRWNQLTDEQECISRLTGEVEHMRQKLSNLDTSVAFPAQEEDYRQAAYAYEQDAYAPEPVPTEPLGSRYYQEHSNIDDTWAMAREHNNLDETQVVPALGPMSAGSSAVSGAPVPMGTTTSAGPLPTLGDGAYGGALATAGPLPRMQRPPGSAPLPVEPFHRTMCGANLALSDDGYTVTRVQGCRQAAAVGSAPLEEQEGGRYFEVVVEDTVAGWVGGLGIGVTATPPDLAGRSPDKAWRMEKTFVVGYGGCIYLDGVERRTNWHPDTLVAGARVGLLVAEQGGGDLIVFVDGQPVVRVEGAGLSAFDALYPVVDVFAATRSVSLCRLASPPPLPWRIAAEPWAAGGGGSSAGSGVRSTRSSASASRTASACDGSQIGGILRPLH